MKKILVLFTFLVIWVGFSLVLRAENKNTKTQSKIYISRSKEAKIPLDKNEKEVTLFKSNKGETLVDLSYDKFKNFVKNFDHRKEDEISLLWLKFPLELFAVFLESFLLLGALLSFISAKKEEKEKNFFKEKDTFRKLWKDIYVTKKDILKYDIEKLPKLKEQERLLLKANIDQLLDLLDDIFQHEKNIFNASWRSWKEILKELFQED